MIGSDIRLNDKVRKFETGYFKRKQEELWKKLMKDIPNGYEALCNPDPKFDPYISGHRLFIVGIPKFLLGVKS